MPFVRAQTGGLLALLALSCDAPGAATRAEQGTGAITPDAEVTAEGDGSIGGSAAAPRVACAAPQRLAWLPDVLPEPSGLAPATQRRQLWAHNDSEQPARLYRLDVAGRVLQRVRVSAAMQDWEDVAAGRCARGTCLYLADIGDNLHARPVVRVLRVREPAAREASIAEYEAFPFRYPEGPADAEAIFVLPGERLFVITKGRNRPVTLYRYPGKLRADTVTLEPVRLLGDGIAQFPDMVTGASATRSGRHVAVRTYAYVDLYHVRNGSLVADARIDLSALAEAQGEGVALLDGGELYLVGERGNREPGPLGRVRCVLP
ncbi:MAG TPA: hypothetical protein VK939_14810 [Longimicrobiales bacterium]|nr:hypothetical protein [Longimicrobiales bacterium]